MGLSQNRVPPDPWVDDDNPYTNGDYWGYPILTHAHISNDGSSIAMFDYRRVNHTMSSPD
jgi:hypothetical protein